MPRSFARAASMSTAAAAPSEVCEALPAVTVPWAWKTGLSLDRASEVVSARGPSSAAKRVSVVTGLPALTPGTAVVMETETSSWSNLPAACAERAFLWLARAKASASSREMA